MTRALAVERVLAAARRVCEGSYDYDDSPAMDALNAALHDLDVASAFEASGPQRVAASEHAG